MHRPIRILVVDDERYSREELVYLLRQQPSIEVVGEAESGKEGLLQAIQLQPDVVFLDIEMPFMNGLETARSLLELKSVPKIVFATAYPQFGADAFRVEAVDYLLKPFDEEQVAETVRRLEKAFPEPFQASNQEQASKRPGKLSIETDGAVIFLNPDDIIYISREGALSKIVTRQSREYEVKTPLKEIEYRLSPYPFFRIHKSYIVHLNYVKRLVPWFNGAYQLEMTGCSEMLPVSRNYAKAFRRELEL
ncbi:LytR/AlgR family response regulator transcription factor [Paenibacillus dakarensis]|uniref:LytR/AlgR family response regulator transcription factor n=1 Tax=Paenibacillus dakarensis TaxID=1527293 RepID=UPI0006D57044|nr:LytTR family DNA-binding domain-containing protein [Paenibacillus dakarensis]